MRPDRRQGQRAIFAPRKEPGARSGVGAPGVGVADVGGEEYHIAPAGGFAGVGDQRRHQEVGVDRGRGRERGRRDDGRECSRLRLRANLAQDLSRCCAARWCRSAASGRNLIGGHAAAFDAVAQDVDRRPKGDFVVGHDGVGWAGHVHGLYHTSHAHA